MPRNSKFFSYYDSLGKHVTDTTQLTNDGKFMFTIDRLNKMQKLFVRFSPNLYTYVFIVPGYQLNLSADLQNGNIFKRSKKVDGNGSIGNLFGFKLDSIETYLRGNFYEKNETQFLKILEQNYQTLANTIYSKEQVHKTDTSLSYIMEVNYLDLQFWKMQHIIDYISFSKSFSKEKKVAFFTRKYYTSNLC